MKKGITIMAVSTIVTVIIILTTVVIISASNIKETTDKTKFVVEILNLQDEIKAYKVQNAIYPINGTIDIDLSSVTEETKKQFIKETINENKVSLNLIDYTSIHVQDRIFGNNKNNKDVYAFSAKTGTVYYVDGIKYKGKTYYTVTEDISDSMGIVTNLKENEIKRLDVIFESSNISFTKNPISVDVKLPASATNINIVTSGVVEKSSEAELDGYKQVKVNNNLATMENYDISVTYNINNITKIVSYSVNNFDNVEPEIDILGISINDIKIYSEESMKKYLTGLKVTDSLSGIKEIKYELENITDVTYFKNYGIIYKDNKIDITGCSYCTVYAVDNAGNELIRNIDLNTIH